MILLICIWAFLINWFAYKKGFYSLPKESPKTTPNLSFKLVLASFGAYLIISLLLLPLGAKLLLLYLHKRNPAITTLSIPLITGLQFFTMVAVFSFLYGYFQNHNPSALKKVWKNRDHTINLPKEFDFGMGIFAWFLSFPLVTILSEIIDRLLKALFQYENFQQTAVKYVKMAMSQPSSLIFALLSVLVMAPLVEEFLFRGILQTFLKKRMGAKGAILLSAFFFALFHFSASQGLGNVSLVLALFVLGGYLGFLYERQGSLWAPIGLHMSFNAVSALRILFFPELS